MRALSAVVVSYNSHDWLPGCLHSVLRSTGVGLEVLVVDNASTDGSPDLVESRFPGVKVVRSQRNLGFAGGANLGVREATRDVVVILNPDVEVRPTTLAALSSVLAGDPQAALAGAKLLYPDGRTIQHAGGRLSYPQALAAHRGHWEEDRGQFDRAQEVEFATGALLAGKKAIIEHLGCFDDGFSPAYYEDSDLCFRVRKAGYRVLYEPRAVAVHYESVTTGRHTPRQYDAFHKNRVRFVLKHFTDKQLLGDFVPVESQWLRNVTSYVELAALRKAYAENAADIQRQAADTRGQSPGHPQPAAGLRLEALSRLHHQADVLLSPREGMKEGPQDRLAVLGCQGQLVEPCFTSGARLVGPLLACIRRAWNWMSTKWYLKPILQQQSEFNGLVVDQFREMSRAASELESRTRGHGRDYAEMETRLGDMAQRLEGLEKRIADMQRESRLG